MKPTTLTKSRFVQAIECPRKLVYAARARYYNAKKDDDFLEALAQGGHLVGKLAKLMFPEGIEVTARSIDDQVAETQALIKQENVILFEPTFRHENLVVRVDVLIKRGRDVELIEVKSKSADRILDTFSKKGHSITAEWRPYIYDVAFQKHVLELTQPDWKVTPYLMVPDKSAKASVDRVCAKFLVERLGRDVVVHVDPEFDPSTLAEPLLRKHDVSAEVEAIVRDAVVSPAEGFAFSDFIDWVATEIGEGKELAPFPGKQCKGCEFYCPPDQVSEDCRSGWNECMQAKLGAGGSLARPDSVFGLWNFRKADTLLSAATLALKDLREGDIEVKEEPNKISRSERHWLQVKEAKGLGEPRVLEMQALTEAFGHWQFPLHFIDFETSRPALPFHTGRSPYDQLLFQFSHHVLEEDGRLRHAHQSLVTSPGVEPSPQVLRDLHEALSGDNGTVIHWWEHERTVLKELRGQLENSNVPDRSELSEFITTLVGDDTRSGRLADLGRLVLNTAFFQGTSGSSSIKKVLPAVLSQSDFLRQRYGRPVYGNAEMPSLNFPAGWTWLVERDGQVQDPYTLLDPLFLDEATREAIAQGEAEETGDKTFIANGGAAMVAYAQLQNPALSPDERQRIEDQLKRYCELDTLAMVMVYEALISWVMPQSLGSNSEVTAFAQ